MDVSLYEKLSFSEWLHVLWHSLHQGLGVSVTLRPLQHWVVLGYMFEPFWRVRGGVLMRPSSVVQGLLLSRSGRTQGTSVVKSMHSVSSHTPSQLCPSLVLCPCTCVPTVPSLSFFLSQRGMVLVFAASNTTLRINNAVSLAQS